MKKTLKIVVLAKQVPDTRNVGKDAMKADGTVNRAALPAIFNPEDLNALEQALVLKDMFPGSRIDLLTMGPGRAAEIIREGMFRGADGGVLLTDRKFAGSDTLATSYAPVACGSQTESRYHHCRSSGHRWRYGSGGPQVAEKLNLPQVTYAEEIVGFEGDELIIRRRLEHGVETVACPLPFGGNRQRDSTRLRRPRNAKLVMKYKHAITPSECQQDEVSCYADLRTNRPLSEYYRMERFRCGCRRSATRPQRIANESQKDRERSVRSQRGETLDRIRSGYRVVDSGADRQPHVRIIRNQI